jgi:hypothetical protein
VKIALVATAFLLQSGTMMIDETRERRLRTPLPWKFALPCSVVASYGPFLFAAIFVLGYDRSSNVRSGMWELLPYSPAFLPTHELHRRLDLNLPGKSDWWVIAHACACSLLIVVAQAWVVRRIRWLGYVLLAGSIAWSAFSALAIGAGLAA